MGHSRTTKYIKSCDGLLIVYAINDRKSFEKIDDWLKEVEEKKNTNSNVPLVLIGNKIDLENEREVNFEEGEKLALKYGMKFYECSAKTGININEAFQYLIDGVVDIYKEEIFSEKKEVVQIKEEGGCCKKKKK